MDAERTRLVEALARVAAELDAGTPLPACLRRLPPCERQWLSEPPAPSAGRRPGNEARVLARIALVAGAADADMLAAALVRLAAELREAQA